MEKQDGGVHRGRDRGRGSTRSNQGQGKGEGGLREKLHWLWNACTQYRYQAKEVGTYGGIGGGGDVGVVDT